MSAPEPHRYAEPPPVDPRIELAAERTMLAWIRTGLAMMGFGFVVARFGLFLREMAVSDRAPRPPALHGMSVWTGTVLVVLGVVVLVGSSIQYVRLLRRLRAGEPANLKASDAVSLALALATLGGAMAIYLVLTAK